MRNKKVLIVEKQKQMVKYLKDFVPWDIMGYEIISIAQGQDKAMAYYGEYNHELIITNLNLQDGDGLSFISFVRKLNNKTKIIVISDDESYSSVRSAFLAGANDYLIRLKLKAIDIVNILESFENYFLEDFNPNWKLDLKTFLGRIRDFQNVNYDILNEAYKNYELNVLNDNYRMVFVRMDNVSYVNKGFPVYKCYKTDTVYEFEDMFLLALRNRENLESSIEEISKEFFEKYKKSFLIFTKNHSFITLIKDEDYAKVKKDIPKLLKSLNENIGQKFSIVISSTNKGYESFLDCYKNVLKVHKTKFYKGDNQILLEDDGFEFSNIDIYEMKNHQQILKCYKSGQCENIGDLFYSIILYFEEKHVDPEFVFSYFETLFSQLKNITIQNDAEFSEIFDEFVLGLRRCESSIMYKGELLRISKVINELISNSIINKSKRYVNAIYQYIETNISNKIFISDISNTLGLTGIHTSRVFKKETNEDLSKYIMKRKMEVAADLLSSYDYLVKEVANSVGFDDQLYFNKVFKKHYGMSPKAYKKTNKTVKK